jgi:hypothetical protein
VCGGGVCVFAADSTHSQRQQSPQCPTPVCCCRYAFGPKSGTSLNFKVSTTVMTSFETKKQFNMYDDSPGPTSQTSNDVGYGFFLTTVFQCCARTTAAPSLQPLRIEVALYISPPQQSSCVALAGRAARAAAAAATAAAARKTAVTARKYHTCDLYPLPLSYLEATSSPQPLL